MHLWQEWKFPAAAEQNRSTSRHLRGRCRPLKAWISRALDPASYSVPGGLGATPTWWGGHVLIKLCVCSCQGWSDRRCSLGRHVLRYTSVYLRGQGAKLQSELPALLCKPVQPHCLLPGHADRTCRGEGWPSAPARAEVTAPHERMLLSKKWGHVLPRQARAKSAADAPRSHRARKAFALEEILLWL